VSRTVGKYEILTTLGAGSMGTVYRAFDPTLQRKVAIKILNRGWTRDLSSEEIAARFHTEARAVARLNHPSIVTIFDYDDQDPAGAYIAMEYVEGCALDQYIRQRPELHLEDAVSVMHQVLGGLSYAHLQGVVHRDIKPSNLPLARDGHVKIMDFGIAKIGSQSQTQSRLMMGTPLYMAPEQYLGGEIDHRCDIHAAGAVLHELLTGSPPYSGTDAEVMYKICHEKPKPPSALDPSIAQAFDPIVAKALEKSVENRYASAADFAAALRSAWQALSPDPLTPKLSAEARTIALAMSRPEIERDSQVDTWVRPATTGAEGALAAWSRDQLAEIERQLVPIVGPVARILVRNAATTTRSRQEIYRLLSDQLRTPEERQRFLTAGGQTGPSPTTAAGTPNPTVSSNMEAERQQ
jgi:eukaryotic-like serine/threonine-protein kinase